MREKHSLLIELLTFRILYIYTAVVMSHDVSTFKRRLAKFNLYRFVRYSLLLLLLGPGLYLFYCTLSRGSMLK